MGSTGKQHQNFVFFQGGKSEIFVDVIERLSVVIGSNVSACCTRSNIFDPRKIIIRLTCWTMLQGVLMKADVEGEVRVKCYMPSCSGESTQLDPPFINVAFIYLTFILHFNVFIYLKLFKK